MFFLFFNLTTTVQFLFRQICLLITPECQTWADRKSGQSFFPNGQSLCSLILKIRGNLWKSRTKSRKGRLNNSRIYYITFHFLLERNHDSRRHIQQPTKSHSLILIYLIEFSILFPSPLASLLHANFSLFILTKIISPHFLLK